MKTDLMEPWVTYLLWYMHQPWQKVYDLKK